MVCDLAEYYGIYDYQGLSVSMLTTLVFGLRDGSRIKGKLNGFDIPLETFLLGYIADSLAFLAWSKTESAQKGKNKPKSIVSMWTSKEERSEYVGFNSIEDFERARAHILEGANNG